jgi:hypothetical protein
MSKKTPYILSSVAFLVVIAAVVFCALVLHHLNRVMNTLKASQRSSEEIALQVEITNSLISSDTIRLKVIEYCQHHSSMSPADCASVGSVIMECSKLYGIPPSLILAIVQKESHFNPSAVSPLGAVGLMQVLPATALPYLRASQIQYSSVQQALMDPVANIRVGSAYLADLHTGMAPDKDFQTSLTAYNYGEDRTRSFLAKVSEDPVSWTYAESVMRLQRDIQPEGVR